jgi:hypothetical protein
VLNILALLTGLAAIVAINNQRLRDRQPKIIEVKFSWVPPTTNYSEIESTLKTQLDEAKKEEGRRYFEE